MVAVHQFVPTYAPRDAVGTHTRHARRVLRDMGIESDIFVDGATGARRGEVTPFRRFDEASRRSGPAWLLYQLSTGTKMADFLAARDEPLVVNYHNVTPWALVAPWEPLVGAELRLGREQLDRLAGRARLGVAVSTYNEGELREAGYPATTVAPVLVDLDGLAAEADRPTLDRLRSEGDGPAWLFVGRVVPHKAQHDVVRAFALYRQGYDGRARLRLVGAVGSHAYWTALRRYVDALGLAGAVTLTGSVTDAELAAHYRAADVFVCLSDHEGFNLPVVEAMRHRVPVVAHTAGAVPETVGDAGLVLPGKEPARVAAAVDRVVRDGALRSALTAAGDQRAAQFTLDRAEARFRQVVGDLLDGAAG